MQLSNVQKITSVENLRSRASDEIVPFREFIIKDDTSALLWFVRFFNGSFRFIRSLIYCSDNGKSFLGGSCLSSAPRVLNRHERCSAPTSWDWTKHTMSNRVVLRTIWWVMEHNDIDTDCGCKFHKRLFDNMVRACIIRTTAITKDANRVRIWISPL